MAVKLDLVRLAEVRQLAASGEAKRLREAADLSLSEVAQECEADIATVWRWEKGLRRPRGMPAMRYGRLLERLRAVAR
jgi:transcriptional regulator with XRE-family HTH domain